MALQEMEPLPSPRVKAGDVIEWDFEVEDGENPLQYPGQGDGARNRHYWTDRVPNQKGKPLPDTQAHAANVTVDRRTSDSRTPDRRTSASSDVSIFGRQHLRTYLRTSVPNVNVDDDCGD